MIQNMWFVESKIKVKQFQDMHENMQNYSWGEGGGGGLGNESTGIWNHDSRSSPMILFILAFWIICYAGREKKKKS